MDLRGEDRRFHEENALLGAASVLKVLALLLPVGWIAILVGGSVRVAVAGLIGTLAAAGIVWAIALVLVSQARVEKNTREVANTLERIAKTMESHKPTDG